MGETKQGISLDITLSKMVQITSAVLLVVLSTATNLVSGEKVALPLFTDLKSGYPGYFHHGGKYNNHKLLQMIGVKVTQNLLIHDTSALRISYTLNKIDGQHSLGTEMIRLSKFGQDSIQGAGGLQYIYLPIAYGPFLADKYGYPTISKLHQFDPTVTEHNFWGKQGILRVITYTKHGNQPKGHVALWDCNHFHQSKDWIRGHTLVTVEFWESPDSNCTAVEGSVLPADDKSASLQTGLTQGSTQQLLTTLHNSQSISSRRRVLKNLIVPKHARHSQHKMRNLGLLKDSSKR